MYTLSIQHDFNVEHTGIIHGFKCSTRLYNTQLQFSVEHSPVIHDHI
jgi:hypothetical protein